jgi:hypothetical protein
LHFESTIFALNCAVIAVATARGIILSMPESEEREHHKHPDFRVNNRIFDTLWPKESRAVVKLPLADQAALLKSSPRTFSRNAWSRQGWTNVHLQHISATQFRELAKKEWRNVAPKKFAAEPDPVKEAT